MQALLEIGSLPDNGLDAGVYFTTYYLKAAEDMLGAADENDLAILLPSASVDHDDWRTALARDLARKYAPKRVNVVARGSIAATEATLAYLRDAPGVTGQYLAAHE